MEELPCASVEASISFHLLPPTAMETSTEVNLIPWKLVEASMEVDGNSKEARSAT